MGLARFLSRMPPNWERGAADLGVGVMGEDGLGARDGGVVVEGAVVGQGALLGNEILDLISVVVLEAAWLVKSACVLRLAGAGGLTSRER